MSHCPPSLGLYYTALMQNERHRIMLFLPEAGTEESAGCLIDAQIRQMGTPLRHHTQLTMHMLHPYFYGHYILACIYLVFDISRCSIYVFMILNPTITLGISILSYSFIQRRVSSLHLSMSLCDVFFMEPQSEHQHKNGRTRATRYRNSGAVLLMGVGVCVCVRVAVVVVCVNCVSVARELLLRFV